MLKIFETNDDYNIKTLNNTSLVSGKLYYVKEDNTAHFYTNNIEGGEAKIYNLGGQELNSIIIGAAIYVKYNKTKDYSVNPYICNASATNSIDCVFLDGEYISGEEVASNYGQFPLENGKHEAVFILKTNEIPNNFFDIYQCADMLEEIIVSDYYTSIGDNFIGLDAPQLKKVTLGNRIINIGESMIYQSDDILISTLVNIPQNIETIGNYAYRGSGIEKAIFPNTITTIGSSAFYRCKDLIELYIPDVDHTVTINGSAFSYCESLKKIYLGKGVTLSTSSVFDYCHIEEVTLNSNVLNYYTGDKWNSLKKLVIGNDVTDDISGIQNCNALETVIINAASIKIANYGLNNNPNLKEVIINEGCTRLGQECLRDCPKLTELEIPSTVTYVGKWCFNGSPIASLTVKATTPPSTGGYLGLPENCKIYVPSASVEAYKAATNWKTYADNIVAIP